MFGQQVCRRLQHDLLAEIVLRLGILDIPGLEERGSNDVLIENRAGKPLRQCSRQSALTCPRKTRNDHDHMNSAWQRPASFILRTCSKKWDVGVNGWFPPVSVRSVR